MEMEACKVACQSLMISDEQLLQVANNLCGSIRRGLNKDTHAQAVVKCWITYVQHLPSGSESGKFLAVDLGGARFRVLLLTLDGQQNSTIHSENYDIPPIVQNGTGRKLFDHIAECVSLFAIKHKIQSESLPISFAFAFPVKQRGISSGILVNWSKGFNCSDVVGKDVVKLLQEAIDRAQLKFEVVALVNNTTGTLITCAWWNHNCKVGLIIGNGTNACYLERIEEVQLFSNPPAGKKHVIINTEWGGFGDDGLLDCVRTEFDNEVDENSLHKGKWKFEKMVGGFYIGEIVRLIIVKLIKNGTLFRGRDTTLLMERNKFQAKMVFRIVADPEGGNANCLQVFEEFGLVHVTKEECAAVRYICDIVSIRAARLVGAGVAVLLNKMNAHHVTIAVDGIVYRQHPKFHDLLVENIQLLLKPNLNFELMLSEDGSGRGAALVAAAMAIAPTTI